MNYTKDEYFRYVKEIANQGHISAVYEYPEGFSIPDFIATADAFLAENGVLNLLKSGVLKGLVKTLDRVIYAYDFSDYEEHQNLDRFETYRIYDTYQSWELTNDMCSANILAEQDAAMEPEAIEQFNAIKTQVIEMPIEQALLVASMIEPWHDEVGGMCHDCDVPPLNVEYVIENNHNYGDVKCVVEINNLLGIDTKVSAERMLEYLKELQHSMKLEVEAQDLTGIELGDDFGY